MVNYSKGDALELSDDSDVEVHPNVDKRSFIRAKQSQIRMEREQRRLQIEALKHERTINDALMQRVCILVSTLQSQRNVSVHSKPADVAFQTIMELASSKPGEDNPPPRPEGVFREDSPPLPTYSKMIAALLDEVDKTLDGRGVESDQRYDAFQQELDVHLRIIQDLQTDLVGKLDALEQQASKKITSESYRVVFDSSYVSKAEKGEAKIKLLNPKSKPNEANADSGKPTKGTSNEVEEKVRPSPAAKKFAEIQASDYHASHEYIASHPEILQNESETDGLLIEAYYAIFNQGNERLAKQYVHQALLLQYCRLLGRDGVSVFFRRLTTPGHQAREMFDKDVAERLQEICGMARRDAKQKGAVEQVQLYPADQTSVIRIQVPPGEREDEEGKRKRVMFERFAPDMRAALEGGSLDEVNRVLGEMDVSQAEKMVGLLDEVRS